MIDLIYVLCGLKRQRPIVGSIDVCVHMVLSVLEHSHCTGRQVVKQQVSFCQYAMRLNCSLDRDHCS